MGEVPEGWNLIAEVAAPRLEYSVGGTIYCILETPEELGECVASLAANLKFTVKDCDPATGEPDSDDGYDDEYQLEDIDVTVADHVSRVMKGNFGAAWEEIGEEFELEDTFQLPFKTMEEAVKNIVTYLGLQPCERSDKVAEGRSSHPSPLWNVPWWLRGARQGQACSKRWRRYAADRHVPGPSCLGDHGHGSGMNRAIRFLDIYDRRIGQCFM